MLYKDFGEVKLSALGFGAMRLPTLPDGSIDREQTFRMVDTALSGGVNYFDTAYPYHGGMSEIVLGEALARHPRESFFLASKFPGHQDLPSFDPAPIFEEQLRKCGVDHFDFYLLHNVIERSMPVYTDPALGILDYFLEQKRLGRIGHLGFSSHARPETLRRFLDFAGDSMEFCQIQLNYLDFTLQDAREKLDILAERGIPVWVMEPLRGGKLASLPEEAAEKLRALRPDASPVRWAFDWVRAQEGVTVILSGMSSEAQLADNLAVFSEERALAAAEEQALLAVAEGLKNAIPCTGCRYCTEGCPMGLDIPKLLSILNEIRFNPSGALTPSMQLDALSPTELPTACIGCGACEAICPQTLPIPELMREFTETLPLLPDWGRICEERNRAAEMARRGK